MADFSARTKIHRIENKKYEENNPDRDQPFAPAMLHSPPERHAFEKSQEQWRAHRQKRAANVADQKNEKRDVHWRDATFVHRDPGANEEHRRANGPDQIREHRADKKKQRIPSRTARRSDAQMNPAGDDKERTDHNHEARVID